MRACLALILIASVSATAYGQPGAAPLWRVHDDSSLEFDAVQQGAEFTGRFEDYEATIRIDPDTPGSGSLSVSVATNSVNTFYDDRDEVLRGPDLLDVERWPAATFVSDSIRKLDGSRFEASGNLTIRDQTQRIRLPFTFELSGDEAQLGGELTIARLDYGVGQGDWSNTEWVGADVTIRFRLRLEAPATVAAAGVPLEIEESK